MINKIKFVGDMKMVPSKVLSTAWSKNFIEIFPFSESNMKMVPSKVLSTAWSKNFIEIFPFSEAIRKW